METCSFCEESFKGYAPLVLRIVKSGGDILVYAQNTSKNIILIKRLLVCINYEYGSVVLFVREGGYYDFYIGGERLEQGATHLKFKISAPTAISARAEAEYIEITSRSVSCLSKFV